MKRINAIEMGIDQGSEMLFSDFDTGGEMWTGNGKRSSRVPVEFSEIYKAIPTVLVSLSMVDADRKTNHRIETVAENISEKGFEIVFRTWGDTKIARAKATWVAIGTLEVKEAWEDIY